MATGSWQHGADSTEPVPINVIVQSMLLMGGGHACNSIATINSNCDSTTTFAVAVIALT